MQKRRKLVIAGDRAIAEIAFEYFKHDSDYEVSAFTVERDFIRRDRVFGLPLVPFEDVEKQFAPTDHDLFIAVGYAQMNRLRARLFHAGKTKGYTMASYVSSHAFVWSNASLGENAFIFENNVIQPFVALGDNVILWSGNHIGHHSRVGNHVFVASHAVISGFVEIGDYSFIGVNATIADNVKIGPDCLVGAAAVVLKNSEPAALFATTSTKPHSVSTRKRFGIEEGE